MNDRSLVFVNMMKAALLQDARLQHLEQLDASLEIDEEAKRLALAMHEAAERYSKSRDWYGPNDPKTKEAQLDFVKAKEALYSQERVAQYERSYLDATYLFMAINKTLFGDFYHFKG